MQRRRNRTHLIRHAPQSGPLDRSGSDYALHLFIGGLRNLFGNDALAPVVMIYNRN